MKIKNNYTSHLGFGSARILPGETIDMNQLPKGYDENHPLIKFYINQGWLETIGGKNKAAASFSKAVSTNIKIDTNAGEAADGNKNDDGTSDNLDNEMNDGTSEETDGESANDGNGTDNDSTSGSQPKPLSRMGKAELQALATKLGLEFLPTDSNPLLVEKIKAVQKKGEE